MTEEELNRLNKKLSEWGEFRVIQDFTHKIPRPAWVAPDNSQIYTEEELPFIQSLDICFKWLVPKLHELGYKVSICSRFIRRITKKALAEGYTETGWKFEAELDSLDNEILGKPHKRPYVGRAETPALALCKAIEKLIDSGGVEKGSDNENQEKV